jgi:hypothetical protein
VQLSRSWLWYVRCISVLLETLARRAPTSPEDITPALPLTVSRVDDQLSRHGGPKGQGSAHGPRRTLPELSDSEQRK